MKELSQFIHAAVSVKTYSDSFYTGTLLAIDQYLNIVLQNSSTAGDAKKGFIFIKGSNILLLTLTE